MSKIADALEKSNHGQLWWAGQARTVSISDRQTFPGPMLPSVPPADNKGPEQDWSRAWVALRKHWRASLVFAATLIGSVVLFTALTKPLYSPTASVEIDPPGAELFSLETRASSDTSADYLETQARNMQADQLLISVMRQLQLNKNTEFTQRGLVSRSISATLTALEHIPSWVWGKKAASVQTASADQQLLTPEESTTLQSMKTRLSVKRDTASRLVTVSFSSHDPVLSARITNAIVRSFIDRTLQTRHAAIMDSTQWLSQQLDDIRTKMEDSNRALAAFQQSTGIADIDENRSTFSEQMSELSRQKTQAQTERIQIESFLRRAEKGTGDNLPQMQNDPVVQVLKQKLAEARSELSQSLAVYGKNHPNIKKLQNQVDELESQIKLQRSSILAQMDTSYLAAMSREEMIDRQLRGTEKELGQMGRYTALKKEAQANSDLYNLLYAKVKEAGITAASKSINIRMVDEARILDTPTSPRPVQNLGIGLFAALFGGVLLAFVFEAFDKRVCTIEDVRRSIGPSAISMVPIAAGDAHSPVLGSLFGHSSLNAPARFLLDQPASEQSEAFRGIQTSVMLSRPDHPPHVLLIASSVPGEGKTTVAVNLAIALAQQGKTCIVDADLRRSGVGRAFHLGNVVGIGEYLADSLPVHAVLTAVPEVATLTVVAAGKPLNDPGMHIASEKFHVLLDNLRRMFTFVVVDSPPILPYADGRALAPFVDGVIFVGRAGVITRDAMARSLELLHEVRSAPILDVVLNGVGTSAGADYSYGYGYGYSGRRAS